MPLLLHLGDDGAMDDVEANDWQASIHAAQKAGLVDAGNFWSPLISATEKGRAFRRANERLYRWNAEKR